MKDIEENDIFIFYLPMVIAALLIQLLLAAFILLRKKDIVDIFGTIKKTVLFWRVPAQQKSLISYNTRYYGPILSTQGATRHLE